MEMMEMYQSVDEIAFNNAKSIWENNITRVEHNYNDNASLDTRDLLLTDQLQRHFDLFTKIFQYIPDSYKKCAKCGKF